MAENEEEEAKKAGEEARKAYAEERLRRSLRRE